MTWPGCIFKARSGCGVENGLGVRLKAGHQLGGDFSGPGEWGGLHQAGGGEGGEK